MNGPRRRVLALIGTGTAVLSAGLSAGLAGINTSPSLPMGLYRTTANSADSLIEFCPPRQYDQNSASRGYRATGVCEDGGAPLLKPVIARAGDVVEVSKAGIAVNGNVLPQTVPRTVDSKGRTLGTWPVGHYVVAAGTMWVASSYNDYSYASRYFGPVPAAAILHHLRPLCTLYSYEAGVRFSRSR